MDEIKQRLTTTRCQMDLNGTPLLSSLVTPLVFRVF